MATSQQVDRLIEALLLLIKRMDKKRSAPSDKVLTAMMERMGKRGRNRTFGSNY